MKMKVPFAACALLVFASVVHGANDPLAWPQFRGPGGSGVAEGERPPIEIGPEKNVKWKVAVPSGMSSPIVVGELLVITAIDEGKLYTIAYHRADGSEAWRTHAPAKELELYHKEEGSPAASTCATDGERIVSYFGSCGLLCYDLAGKELWKLEMEPAQTMAGFGTGVSPILTDGTVVLMRDEFRDPKIIAIDAATGEIKWEKKRHSRTCFGTPVVWDTPAGKQIAAPGFGRMIGYELQSGDEAWHVEGMPSGCCTTPVTAGGELFFAGWSPGDPAEGSESQMPSYDEFLKDADTNGDGTLAKEEAESLPIKDFFDSLDANKDGKYTREESKALDEFMAASRNSAFALKPGGRGDITASHVRWKNKKGLPYVPSAIVYQGQYVMVKDGGIVTAYDVATGKELYMKRAVASGSYYASPVAANGNVYFASLNDGVITVLKGGEATPTVVVENPPLGDRLAATPAIADDTLYVRTAGHLYAFTEQK
jgi:outer membrane protein assembly factor BamB